MAKKLNVIVKKMPANYGAFIEEVDGFVITRKTLNQIINDLPQAIKFHIEALNDYEIQPWMLQEIEFTYHYDIDSLLDKYQGILNQANISRITGINESLLRQYVLGIKKPGKKQIIRIQEKLHTFAGELSNVNIRQ
ncbi:MAG: hypothetical protein LBS69_10135 [Prevotellaceae bacterium]|jgi:predicted RNase H-like HicB family nuclease|nr:hypothetical protein [Prevotellaceae bacterium]